MMQQGSDEKRGGRGSSPEIWALGALVAITLLFPTRGPAMQVQWASCGPAPVMEIGVPLEQKIDRLAEEIDVKTVRVWRRLEMQMKMFEQRLAKNPANCDAWRDARASMNQD